MEDVHPERKSKPLQRAIVVLVVVSAIAVPFVFLAPVHQFSYDPCNESSTCPYWSISVSESISCWTGAGVGSSHATSVFWLRSDLSKYHLGCFPPPTQTEQRVTYSTIRQPSTSTETLQPEG
jgi:hypothetical protein